MFDGTISGLRAFPERHVSASIVYRGCGIFRSRRCYRTFSGARAQVEADTCAPDVLICDRRLAHVAVFLGASGLLLTLPPASTAIGFKKELKKKKIPLESYSTSADGLQYYDLSIGDGSEITAGKKITVHFDCLYKGIDVASSRSARLLGGNRTIAEPFEFVVGEKISAVGVKKISDSANGLFSGSGGPQPPPVLSTAVIGMKAGGKRSIIVPPELGYGSKGLQEIPPDSSFELQVEVLSVA